jgi:flagella basal body P-ring formation protein FlgA
MRSALAPSVLATVIALGLGGGAASAASAQAGASGLATPSAASLAERMSASARAFANHLGASASAAGSRVEIEVGALDPLWQLAPCERIEPFLPPGLPAWGRTRVGLRCAQGAKAWSVSLPVSVRIFKEALVASATLPAGTPLQAAQFQRAEVDITAAPGAPISDAAEAQSRVLARSLSAGSPLRASDLKPRLWFAAGERVRVLAGGAGWQIATEGEALSAGVEGQAVRVRAENGKLLQGRAVATRTVEVGL